MKKVHKLPPPYKGLKDPDRMFDLVCFQNYIAADLGKPIPVEESRAVFEVIKQLLSPKEKDI